MVNISTELISGIANIFLLVLTVVKARCPHNAANKVQQCTANVLPKLHQDPNAEGPNAYTTHVQVARETCRNDRLREAADCIEGIMDKCQGTTDQEQMLQRLINKDKLLDTVDYFCRHFRIYEENAKCISRHHEEVSKCSLDAQRSFLTKVSAGANMDVLISGSCRFHAVARTCLTDTVELHCGDTAANFVYTLLTGLMPPFCDSTNPEYRPVDSDTTRRWNQNGYQDDYSHDYNPNCAGAFRMSIFWTVLFYCIIKILN